MRRTYFDKAGTIYTPIPSPTRMPRPKNNRSNATTFLKDARTSLFGLSLGFVSDILSQFRIMWGLLKLEALNLITSQKLAPK